MEPEPIPIQALSLLLNYERQISELHYQNVRLVNTSMADEKLLPGMVHQRHVWFEKEPESVKKRNIHVFLRYDESQSTAPLLATCLIHPLAAPEVQALSRVDRDLVFNETRGQNGCYKSVEMWQDLTDLFPKDQKLSIQVGKGEPTLVDARARIYLDFRLFGPVLHTRTWIKTGEHDPAQLQELGATDGGAHCVLASPWPGPMSAIPATGFHDSSNYIVVDLSRMQYGKAGRGVHGEHYFVGTYLDCMVSMNAVCEKAKLVRAVKDLEGDLDPLSKLRVKTCAQRVWDRWQNREQE